MKRIQKYIIPSILTLAVVGLLAGIISDLNTLYWNTVGYSGSIRVPRSLLVIAAFAVLVSFLFLFSVWGSSRLIRLRQLRRQLKWGRWVLSVLVALAVSYFFLFTRWSEPYSGFYIRLFFNLFAVGLMAWLNTDDLQHQWNWGNILGASIIYCSIFSVAVELRSVVSYPFSLAWSEGNRLWDYSVLFGRRLYDYPANKSIFAYIDRGRQSLWGLPFLLPSVSIQGVRLWSVIVWTLPYALLGWLFFTPRQVGWKTWVLFGLWSYLFLQQGPIYSPLVLAAILVAVARRTPKGVTILLVLAASYYARISRFTWMFAPGIWAVVNTMIDSSPEGLRLKFDHWKWAVVFGISGIAGGMLPDLVNKINSIRHGTVADPSVLSAEGLSSRVENQPLLWDRLWPNPTYSLGIVYGLLLATLPVILVLVYSAVRRRWKLNLWQGLALVGSLLAFLAVGLVASVKIGGGSNLHNLDMFLIGVLFAVGLAWDKGLRDLVLKLQPRTAWLAVLILFTVIYPAYNDLMTAGNVEYPYDRVPDALSDIQKAVDEAKPKGEILFMDQRQLLTFGAIKGVALVPDYEKKYIMDEAMAEDQKYFNKFNQDIANHRFSLIVSEPLWVKFQGENYIFGNENDAWVKWVSIPILCYYEPVVTYQDIGFQILIPKEKSSPKAGVECPKPQ